jgi:hypothetical protein
MKSQAFGERSGSEIPGENSIRQARWRIAAYCPQKPRSPEDKWRNFAGPDAEVPKSHDRIQSTEGSGDGTSAETHCSAATTHHRLILQ